MVTLWWFDRPQFPPSIIKKKSTVKKIPIFDGYEADSENSEKSLPVASKKR